jgi:glycosyltransferase involved in cell wall biosynthesis
MRHPLFNGSSRGDLSPGSCSNVQKILLFYFCELGGLGGVEVAVRLLAGAFTERGRPSGIVELTEQWKPQRLLPSGIPVWGVSAPSYTTMTRPRSWASFLRSSWQFSRVIREFAPDIVHVHYPLSQALPVIGAQAIPHRWRLVVTVHNSDIRVSPFQEPRIRPWQARLFERADAVTAVSESLLSDATELYPCIQGKGHVIYNGVGSTWFRKPAADSSAEGKYVLFVGRLNEVKGVDILLQAWKQVCARFPAVQLWFAGDGPELENLQAGAKESGIVSNVRFLGRTNQTDLPDLYRKAEVVVLPSRREGLPFTLLEAGACGAITIGTKIPGIPEIIQDGVTGLLVETESSGDLASAISQILEMPAEQRYRMKEAAYKNVTENFSEETMISSYFKVFDSLSGTKKR